MTWAYYLGGLTLFFLMIQVATGVLLLFYYQPNVNDANASVEFITHHVRGGALVRNMHAWAASLMIFSGVAHLLTTFAMKAFEKPREIIWVSGVVLLLITFAFGFTGYLLPWNQIAVNATKVGLQTMDAVGNYLPEGIRHMPARLRETIQGGPDIGGITLTRFYAVHVVVLPLLMFAVLGFHLLLIQLHGMSDGVDRSTGRSERFFPFFLIRDLSLWTVTFVILVILGLCLPFESFSSYALFQPFNPLASTPEGIRPEWYFYFIYYPLELLPFWVVALLLTALLVVLFFTPVLFRRFNRRALTCFALAATVYLIAMTLFGQQFYELFRGEK